MIKRAALLLLAALAVQPPASAPFPLEEAGAAQLQDYMTSGRYTARQIAGRYPVSGFVENKPDGRVLVVAEGETADVNEFLTALESEKLLEVRFAKGKLAAVGDQWCNGRVGTPQR